MNKKILLIFSILNLSLVGKTYTQCEADHLVILNNFSLHPLNLQFPLEKRLHLLILKESILLME